MSDKQRARWLEDAIAQPDNRSVENMARMTGAFYRGLLESGVSEGAAILMTQTYITSMVTAGAQLAKAKGAK